MEGTRRIYREDAKNTEERKDGRMVTWRPQELCAPAPVRYTRVGRM